MEVLTPLIARLPDRDTPIGKMLQKTLFTLIPAAFAAAFPQETGSPTVTAVSSTTNAAGSSMITTAPGLTCTGGSTVLYTQDCTYGFPVSYCYSPPPPISCGEGYFPSVYHPGKAVSTATCAFCGLPRPCPLMIAFRTLCDSVNLLSHGCQLDYHQVQQRSNSLLHDYLVRRHTSRRTIYDHLRRPLQLP